MADPMDASTAVSKDVWTAAVRGLLTVVKMAAYLDEMKVVKRVELMA